jgi:hypothetical protein
MSDESTKRMLAAVEIEAPAPLFLAGSFKLRPGNIHDSEKIEMDGISPSP